MLQPVLLVMEVCDDTDKTELGKNLESYLRPDWDVRWAIPMSYTLDVPADVVK